MEKGQGMRGSREGRQMCAKGDSCMEAAAAFAALMDQLAGFVEDACASMRRQWRQAFQGTNTFTTFLHAVNWKEPWLLLLISFHIMNFMVAIMTRKRNNIQMGLFLFSLLCVHFAERLNTFLAHHWTSFATRPYFDHAGIFISVVWSGPFLIIACEILVNSLVTLTALIIKWKKAELRHRARMVVHKQD